MHTAAPRSLPRRARRALAAAGALALAATGLSVTAPAANAAESRLIDVCGYWIVVGENEGWSEVGGTGEHIGYVGDAVRLSGPIRLDPGSNATWPADITVGESYNGAHQWNGKETTLYIPDRPECDQKLLTK